MGADNQQERPLRIGWVVGFVEGEGCFSISFVRQSGNAERRGYKTGYQVTHEFVVTQSARNLAALQELERFFGVGQVLGNKRYDNHREHLYRFVVRRRIDLLGVIIPFFREHRMVSAKQDDFEKFARCVEMIDAGRHLTRQGMVEIAMITETMNRRKPRNELIGILRDHTPNIRDTG
jgi:hypothetical protein